MQGSNQLLSKKLSEVIAVFKTRKVVIIGAGHVGSHVGLALAQSGEADEIVLIDIVPNKAAAQAMDIDDAISGSICGRPCQVREGSYADLNDADIMIMSFGRTRKKLEDRLDMFEETVRVANEVVSHLKQVDFQGIMISISNPADIVCEHIRRKMQWKRNRCFCTGTGLETFRLVRILTKATGYSRNSLQAYCMGEHGNSSFVVWSKVKILGENFEELCQKDSKLAALDLADIQHQVRVAANFIYNNKECTEFGIANVALKLIKAIFHDEKIVWPCSTALEGEFGQHDVAIGVPCVIGKNGMEKVYEVELSPEERGEFTKSCDIIRSYLIRSNEVK